MPRYLYQISPRCLVRSVNLIPTVPGKYVLKSVSSDVSDQMNSDSLQVMETDLEVLFRAGINPSLVPSPSFVERPDTRIRQGHELLDALSRQPETPQETPLETSSESSINS